MSAMIITVQVLVFRINIRGRRKSCEAAAVESDLITNTENQSLRSSSMFDEPPFHGTRDRDRLITR